ncbi:hypothetical protein SAMN05216533_0289 [Streptomyces sp. Ag109_O5-10]|nr:hypothetical protein SAMN05216533_0289 [Streptomyces sp. Ag109_O5-10]
MRTPLAPSRLCGAVHFTCRSRRLGRKGPAHPGSPGFPAASLSVAMVEFARGGERGKSLRDTASAALRAGVSVDTGAAREAARAAMSAAAAYLHPLTEATQVRHILGAGAHAARAAEFVAGDSPGVGAVHVERVVRCATPAVVGVLERFLAASGGGGRVGELIRMLDAGLRSPNFPE